jgi:parallel beta-helix repeat protein
MSTPDRFATRRWIPVLLLSEVLAVAVLGGARLEAATIYVSTAGNDGNSGLSWAAAKKTVQAGLNAAASGDQVWVAKGTYVECITLKAGVSLYGGFAGGETDLAQRNRTTNVTILDGNNHFTVVASPMGATQTTRIDGFTIRNGFGADYGSGISCNNSSPTIINNTITANRGAGYGGGIYCRNSSAIILNNIITGNTGLIGGGIYCGSGASPIIACNVIAGNSGTGGGIAYEWGAPTIVNNTITLNCGSTGMAGGIWCAGDAATIANNMIAFNSSGLSRDGTNPVLRNNCVYGNPGGNYLWMTDPTGTHGNISEDPKLAGLSYANLHIQPDSPCRNAGDPGAVQAGWLDMDGQDLPLDGQVDIGADESDGTAWSAGPYTIVRVSLAGNDANNGSSWALAKRTVQAALDAAEASGGEVWVREGVYTELIRLRPFMHVYGGFSGTETRRTDRNWISSPSVLDGYRLNGSVVTAQAGYRASTIDGFTIRNGYGTPAGSNTYGGGMYLYMSSPTVANCTITRNTATASGGGVFSGGVSFAALVNCVISANTAGNQGGGVYAPAFGTMVNCAITGNSASSGGGIYCGPSTYPSIVDCTIAGNSASGDGGGIYCSGYPAQTITNSIIASNSSGIFKLSGTGVVSLRFNCVYGNAAYNYSGVPDPTGTDGNISADPRFVRPPSPGADGTWGTADDDYGDLHLLPGSPCIDAGGNADVPPDAADLDADGNTTEPTSLDLDRKLRFVDDPAAPDTGTGTPPIVDMGAYERCIPGAQHVWPAGNDANDGLTWATAKQTVRAGLNAAIAGEQVWVAAGTYVETIVLSPGVALYGGFAGTETDLAQRNWKANETILDGNQAGSVVTASGVIGPDARLDGFTIRNGKAASGGGICCSGGSPTIVNNTVTANSATSTGGGIYGSASSMVVANNTVTSNEAPTGGGIYCTAGSPLIRDNLIARNLGGGVYSFSSSAMLLGNTIAGNTASQGGGGIRCQGSVAGTIANNVIVGNSAMVGGGIWCNSCTPMIANNTIIANSATGTTPYGGGILCVGSSPAIVNTIVNTLVAFNSSGIYRLGGSTVLLRCDCVYGNAQYDYGNLTDPTGTDGNISADPNFVRAASPGADGTWGTADDDYGDLRLPAGSPCIDAGRNADVPADAADLDGDGNTTEPLPLDLAGKARLAEDPGTVDTGSGTPPIVDIGAYEYVCAGDVDGDGHVDVSDLLCLVNSWAKAAGQAGFDSRCDQDGDGRVSILDLLVLVNHWGL